MTGADAMASKSDDGNGWRTLPSDAGKLPATALELGQETLSKRARIQAAKRDGAGAVWIGAADGPRAIDRANTADAKDLLGRAADYHRLNGDSH